MVYIKQVEKPPDFSRIEVMESQKLPFEITPQIKRSLEDFQYLIAEKYLLPSFATSPRICLIQKKIDGSERFTPQKLAEYLKFQRYLGQYGIGFLKSFSQIKKKQIIHVVEWKDNKRTAYCFSYAGNKKTVNFKKMNIEEKLLKMQDNFLSLGVELKGIEIAQSINLKRLNSFFGEKYYILMVEDVGKLNKLLEETLLSEEKLPKTDENIKVENYRSSKVEFNGQTAVLSYKTLSHKFQKGIMGDPQKLKLFKQLWDNRLHIRKGKKIAVGSALDHVALAVGLGIAQERHSYEINKELRNDFDQLVKDVKKPLKKKGFPLEIKRKNGVQLVIIEK